jgi:ZIP family zinc transporter
VVFHVDTLGGAGHWRPGRDHSDAKCPAVSSAIQHLAAGVVFAAAATEVLPDLQHQGSVSAILIGGGLGLATMFGVKALGSRMSGAWSLIILIGIDIFIDGVVLGIGFAAGGKQGGILSVALTLEILFWD